MSRRSRVAEMWKLSAGEEAEEPGRLEGLVGDIHDALMRFSEPSLWLREWPLMTLEGTRDVLSLLMSFCKILRLPSLSGAFNEMMSPTMWPPMMMLLSESLDCAVARSATPECMLQYSRTMAQSSSVIWRLRPLSFPTCSSVSTGQILSRSSSTTTDCPPSLEHQEADMNSFVSVSLTLDTRVSSVTSFRHDK